MEGPKASAPVESKPYKGPESYQPEDVDLFFGREHEAEQLIARILSSRFTLLHAQSGAGKTSLLNARIIPGLEERGWIAFRILPQNDPVKSVRDATFRYVLPPLEAEIEAVVRARSALFAADEEDPTLHDLLERYDALPKSDARRRTLLEPFEWKAVSGRPGSLLDLGGRVTPHFCRLLGSRIEVADFAEHIAAVRESSPGSAAASALEETTRLSQLLQILGDPALGASYDCLIEELNVPISELAYFFQNLVEVYGQRRSRFALVLILDQFEEMFTRFLDLGYAAHPAASDLPDWRLRWGFFQQLERLYHAENPPGNPAARGATIAAAALSPGGSGEADINGPALPIRYVISMRDEYIAQLDPLRRFIPALDDNAYHLMLLDRDQAGEAIRMPAGIFGYAYSEPCYAQILWQLTKEDRYIEPSHLQLVCEKLWTEKGRELAAAGRQPGGESLEIREDTFASLGGTGGILRAFFHDFLDALDDSARFEVLDMLDPLVTSSGTRNIMQKDRILCAPFRDGERRRDLLASLEDRRIVRTEPRLGGNFVEITHEFLIKPILEAIRDEKSPSGVHGRLREALRTLARYEGMRFGGNLAHLLYLSEFLVLHECRDDIHWDIWSAELMLRSAILLNRDRSVLEFWRSRCETLAASPDETESSLPAGLSDAHRDDLITLNDLKALNACREDVTLTPEQTEAALRSALFWSTDAERSDVGYWVGRMEKHGT